MRAKKTKTITQWEDKKAKPQKGGYPNSKKFSNLKGGEFQKGDNKRDQ